MRQRFSTWIALGMGLAALILALIFALVQSL